MSQLIAHLAVDTAATLNDPTLEHIIRSHRPDGTNAYRSFPCPVKPDLIPSIFDKFCRNAIIPPTSPKEAHFIVNNFSASDIKAFVWLLSDRQVHSEFCHTQTLPYILHLVIRDANNTHLANTMTPVSSIEMKKNMLIAEDRKAAAKEKPPYIPPFNVITTERRIHILLDHMHPQDKDLLEEALQYKGADFTPEDHEEYGTVLTIRFKDVMAVSELREESRTADNIAKMSDFARIYRPAKGCPTINLLTDRNRICIPLEGMMINQIEALKARIAHTRLPYEQVNHPDFGIALSFDQKYSGHLEAWRTILRAESKRNMIAAETQPTPPNPV